MDIDTLIVLFVSLDHHSDAGEQGGPENCMRNTHVQTFELIEESFDSNPWFSAISLCIDGLLMNVCFLSCICFYMLCM
jgi:hypothetical protein